MFAMDTHKKTRSRAPTHQALCLGLGLSLYLNLLVAVVISVAAVAVVVVSSAASIHVAAALVVPATVSATLATVSAATSTVSATEATLVNRGLTKSLQVQLALLGLLGASLGHAQAVSSLARRMSSKVIKHINTKST